MSFTSTAGDLCKPVIAWHIMNPTAIGGEIAVAVGLRNPHTRGWTIRMLNSYGRNSAIYAYHIFTDTVLITWSETVGAAGRTRRAGNRAAVRAAQQKALLKKGAPRLGAGAIARKGLARAVPVIGWAILAYDIADYAYGDDPSFIGDVLTWATS